MKKKFFTLCIIMLSSTIRGQIVGEPDLSFTLSPVTIRARHYNFGFENVAVKKSTYTWWHSSRWGITDIGDNRIFYPEGWFQLGYGDYSAELDSVEKRSGRYSSLIERIGNGESLGGSVCYDIPVEYTGRNIEVRAWLKGEGKDNTIGLMMQFDGEPNVRRVIDEMKQRNISAPAEWTEYSIMARLPEDAETIRIGAILSGNGKLWVDDFRVLIDGKDIRELQLADLKYKALNDDEFNEGSYIAFGTLTSQMVENLALLAKVWGFAKYYHPAVGTGDYHWDYVLFKAMASILNARNIDERNTVLYLLLYGLGDFRTVRRLNIPNSRSVTMLPDLDWIDDIETFGEDLSKKMNEVKMARRDTRHHYIGLDRYHASKFRHEYDYAHISPDDDGYRMLALFRFWNMVQYFYPYRYRLKENWHDTLIEFIPKVAQANSSNYRQIFTDLVIRLGDPQTYNVYESPDFGNNSPPLQIVFAENKPVVTGITMEDIFVELMPGDIILKVNQKPVEEIMEQIRENLESSRYIMPNLINYFIVTNILRTDYDIIQIEYQRDGRTFTANLRCYPTETLYENRIVNTLPGHELLSDEVGYFCPPFFNNDKINEAMSEFSDTKGIIIDLRNPLTYNWAYVIARFLTATPIPFSLKTIADIQIPGLFIYSDLQRIGVRNRRYYTGKIVLLVNQNTNQYGELTAMAFRALPNTVIIGSSTGSQRFTGYSLSPFHLPVNIFGVLSGHGLYFPDNSEIVGLGIVPDFEVKPTIRGIIEGRDELLEKAKQIILD